MEELKPCPFCGSEAKLIKDYASVVVCSNPQCFISMEAMHGQILSENKMIIAWNRRIK